MHSAHNSVVEPVEETRQTHLSHKGLLLPGSDGPILVASVSARSNVLNMPRLGWQVNSETGGFAELRRYSPFLLSSRRDNTIEAQGETRRVSRALSLPWVRGHLSAESQRDGPNPRRIVRPIPIHDSGRVHGTHPERSFVDDVVAGSGCTSRVGHEDRRCAATVAGSSWKTQCGRRSAPMILAYPTRPV